MYESEKETQISQQVFLCFGCGNEFNDPESQQKHEASCPHTPSLSGAMLHNADLYYTETELQRKTVCEICRAYFGDPDFLQDHKLLHLNSDNVCYLCETYYVTSKLLAHHVMSDHRDRLGIKQNEEGVNEPYICSVCILRFSTLKGLQSHEITHVNENRTILCRICKVTIDNEQKSSNEHFHSVAHAAAKRKVLNVFTCIHCNTSFATRDSYAMHMMLRAKDENCVAKRTRTTGDNQVKCVKDIEIKQEPNSEDKDSPNELRPRQGVAHNRHSLNNLGLFFSTSGSFRPGSSNHRKMSALENNHCFNWTVPSRYRDSLMSSAKSSFPLRVVCEKCGIKFQDRDELAMHTMSVHSAYGGEKPNAESLLNLAKPTKLMKDDVVPSMLTYRLLPVNANSSLILRCDDSQFLKRKADFPNNSDNASKKRPSSAPSNLLFSSQLNTELSVKADPISDDPVKFCHQNLTTNDNGENSYVKQNDTYTRTEVSDRPIYNVSKPIRSTMVEETNYDKNLATYLENKRELEKTKKQAVVLNIEKYTKDTPINQETVNNVDIGFAEDLSRDNDVKYIKSAIRSCGDRMWMCKYCSIVFLDKTLYCLHMGMHNVNRPYQCNMCGYKCESLHEFSAHVLHFQ